MNKLAAAVVLAGAATLGLGQTSSLYSPNRNVQDQGIALKGWGSGTISQTEETAVDGVYSIRVSTRNYFQGGIITFAEPKNLSSDFQNKTNLLRIAVRVADSSQTLGGATGGATGGGGAAGGGDTGTMSGGGGAAGGMTAGGGMGAGNRQGTTATPPKVDTSLHKIRVIITTTDGLKSEAYVEVPRGAKDWSALAIPLQAISGFDRTNKIVKDMWFSGDSTATFYVGDLKVVNDTTPITGDVDRREANLALGDDLTLTANGYGGSTELVYKWEFASADGREKATAEGRTVTRKFRRPGEYLVTLTISDKYGLKDPFKTTVKVTVNP